MNNAIKFSKKGSEIMIYCKIVPSHEKPEFLSRFSGAQGLKVLESNQDILIVSVIDQGVGIKSEDLLKLFTMFGFIDTTKDINT